jgi:hypothetical protein
MKPWHVYAVFLGWTSFAVFVFARVTSLGDSEAYLSGVHDDHPNARTFAIAMLAQIAVHVGGGEFGAHLLFSAVAASGMAYLLASAQGVHHWSQSAILFNPCFGTFAAAAGREALLVAATGACLGAVLRDVGERSWRHLALAIVSASTAAFLRPGFGASLLLLAFVHAALRSSWRSGVSLQVLAGAWSCAMVLVGVMVLDDFADFMDTQVLPTARLYFTPRAPMTRLWAPIASLGDMVASLWWSIPLILVGPTPGEVFERPALLPHFIGGLVVVAVLIDGFIACATVAACRRVLVLAWIPAVAVGLFGLLPFSIVNAGSGTRYMTSLLPVLLLPRLLAVVLQLRPVRGHG